MSSPGIIGFSQIGAAQQPSPSIWADCRNTLLRDLGLGYFAHEEFLGNIEIATFADASVFGSGFFDVDADTGALAPLTGVTGGYAKFTTGANDNDAIAIFSQNLGKIVRNSGNKLWLEANFNFTTLPDAGFFFGFTTLANATRDVVADNPSNSAVAGLTAATVVGFASAQASSAIATLDAKYAKSTGTPVTVLANVTNATAITAAGGTVGNLVAATDRKLGIRFDGLHKIEFYVDGYLVASQDVDGTVDQTSDLVAVMNYKTGTANARALSFDWIRYASQLRS